MREALGLIPALKKKRQKKKKILPKKKAPNIWVLRSKNHSDLVTHPLLLPVNSLG
jgi:hypothetical protein